MKKRLKVLMFFLFLIRHSSKVAMAEVLTTTVAYGEHVVFFDNEVKGFAFSDVSGFEEYDARLDLTLRHCY